MNMVIHSSNKQSQIDENTQKRATVIPAKLLLKEKILPTCLKTQDLTGIISG